MKDSHTLLKHFEGFEVQTKWRICHVPSTHTHKEIRLTDRLLVGIIKKTSLNLLFKVFIWQKKILKCQKYKDPWLIFQITEFNMSEGRFSSLRYHDSFYVVHDIKRKQSKIYAANT